LPHSIIAQDFDTGEHPIAYYSQTLLPAQTRYSTTERELLGELLSVRKFRYCILGRRTLIDAIRNFSNPRLYRWALELSKYDLEIRYTPGRSHLAAHCLSRRPSGAQSKTINIVQAPSVLPWFDCRQIREEQQRDPELKTIIERLRSEDPSAAAIFS